MSGTGDTTWGAPPPGQGGQQPPDYAGQPPPGYPGQSSPQYVGQPPPGYSVPPSPVFPGQPPPGYAAAPPPSAPPPAAPPSYPPSGNYPAPGSYPPPSVSPVDPHPSTAASRDQAKQWAEGMVEKHGTRNLLHFAVPALTALGVILPPTSSFLRHNTVWALFALAAAVVTLAGRKNGASNWTTAAAAGAGLFVFWVLVALPSVTGINGFLITAATAAAAGALLMHPDRKW